VYELLPHYVHQGDAFYKNLVFTTAVVQLDKNSIRRRRIAEP